jgi:hypothetical protein
MISKKAIPFPPFLRRPVTYILLLSLVLFTVGIGWGLPSSEDWLSDSLAPFHPLIGLSQGFSFGYLNKYPLVHQLLLAILNIPVLVTALINSNPMEGLQFSRFFMLIRSDQYATALILMARLVSVFMGVGIIFGMYRCAKLLFGERAALYTALLVSFNGVLNFYSHMAKVEVPYLFWGVWGIYMLIRVLKYDERRDYILLALFACLSYGTKDQGYSLFVFPFILYLVFYRVLCRDRGSSVASVLFGGKFLLFIAVFITASLITQNVFLNYDGFLYRLRILTGWNMERSVTYTMDAAGLWGLLRNSVFQMIECSMGRPVYYLCLSGLSVFLATRFRKGRDFFLESVFLVSMLSVYICFVQVIRQDNARHTLAISIFLAVYGGYLLNLLHEKTRGIVRYLLALPFVALCAYSLYFTVSVNMNFLNDIRYDVEKWMGSNMPKEARIEYYSYIHYLPRFPQGSFAYRITNDAMNIEKRRPDFLILTSHYYPRFIGGTDDTVIDGRIVNTAKAIKNRTEKDMSLFLRNLFADRLNYRLIKRFQTGEPWYRTVTYSKISPDHIIIYKRIPEQVRDAGKN